MHFVVYIDLIFLVNVVMDFLVLFIMKELMKKRTTIGRLSIAAMTASFGSCITIVFQMPVFLKFIILYGLVSGLTLQIAFGIKSWKDYLNKILVFFGIAFFIDGFLNFIYCHLDIEQYYKKTFSGTFLEQVSVIYFIAGIGGIILVSPIILFLVSQIRENALFLCYVKLKNRGKEITGTGLLDTGNRLFDPLSGEPVILAEFEWVKELFTVSEQRMLASYMNFSQVPHEGPRQMGELEGEPIMIRMIPFHSVGREQGMLVAVRLDSIWIGEQSGLKRRENVLIGLYPGRVSAREMYQVILHNSLT